MRLPSIITACLLAIMALATPAFAASQSGTLAYSTSDMVLSAGPGSRYPETGRVIPAQSMIKVLRCQRLWCLVDGDMGRGWTSKRAVAFGKPPVDLPPNPDKRPAAVCFYTGANYTGESLCATSGSVIQDFALINRDNHFVSVEIIGATKLDACRDRFFQSYCELIEYSQPVMDQYLQNNLSSAKIY